MRQSICTHFILTDNAGLLFKKIVVIHILPKNAYFPIGFYQVFKLLPVHQLSFYYYLCLVFCDFFFFIVIVELFISLSLDGLYYQFERALT